MPATKGRRKHPAPPCPPRPAPPFSLNVVSRKVQEGREGRSDALLVSQFGFTRGGAVSRVDLDPTPRLPRLFAGVAGGGADGGRGGAVVVGDGGGGGLLSDRTQPRLTGTWAGPLLWPNEVNPVREGEPSLGWVFGVQSGGDRFVTAFSVCCCSLWQMLGGVALPA